MTHNRTIFFLKTNPDYPFIFLGCVGASLASLSFITTNHQLAFAGLTIMLVGFAVAIAADNLKTFRARKSILDPVDKKKGSQYHAIGARLRFFSTLNVLLAVGTTLYIANDVILHEKSLSNALSTNHTTALILFASLAAFAICAVITKLAEAPLDYKNAKELFSTGTHEDTYTISKRRAINYAFGFFSKRTWATNSVVAGAGVIAAVGLTQNLNPLLMTIGAGLFMIGTVLYLAVKTYERFSALQKNYQESSALEYKMALSLTLFTAGGALSASGALLLMSASLAPIQKNIGPTFMTIGAAITILPVIILACMGLIHKCKKEDESTISLEADPLLSHIGVGEYNGEELSFGPRRPSFGDQPYDD